MKCPVCDAQHRKLSKARLCLAKATHLYGAVKLENSTAAEAMHRAGAAFRLVRAMRDYILQTLWTEWVDG